jgi:hypothetical protein
MKNARRKYRFKRHCARRSFFSKMANKFRGCHVGYGNWSNNSTIIKGLSGPVKESLLNLRQSGVKVTVIDEFLTSQICNNCLFVNKPPTEHKLKELKYHHINSARCPNYNLSCYDGIRIDTKSKRPITRTSAKVLFCTDGCHYICNRDLNASSNILEILRSLLKYNDRPEPFRR